MKLVLIKGGKPNTIEPLEIRSNAGQKFVYHERTKEISDEEIRSILLGYHDLTRRMVERLAELGFTL